MDPFEAAFERATQPNKAKQGMYALGRLKQGQLNKTEAEYELFLKVQQQEKKIEWFKFEGMKFRLANNTFYTPDFAVMQPDRSFELHEVKGFWTDDARVKIKVAAGLYPIFRFLAVQKQSKKAGGGWAVEEF